MNINGKSNLTLDKSLSYESKHKSYLSFINFLFIIIFDNTVFVKYFAISERSLITLLVISLALLKIITFVLKESN